MASITQSALLLPLLLFTLLTPCRSQYIPHHPDYCAPSTRVPEAPPRSCSPPDGLTSCAERCNQTQRAAGHAQAHCRCDAHCALYRDCCPDFRSQCPLNYVQGMKARSKQVHFKVDCVQFLLLEEEEGGSRRSYVETVSLISSCANGDACVKTSHEDILHPNLAVPITDLHTGFHYINFHCAKCNNVTRFRWWTPRLECDEPADESGSPVVTDHKSLEHHLRSCGLHYLKPQDDKFVTRYGCKSHGLMLVSFLHSTCPSTCLNSYLMLRCEDSIFTDYFQVGGRIYPNFYCAMCHSEDLDELACYKSPGSIEVVSLRKHSLSVLYNFDPSDGLRVGEFTCPSGHEFVSKSKECEKVFCPDDFIRVEEDCVPTRFKGVVSVLTTFRNTQNLAKAFLEFKATDSVKDTLDQETQPAFMQKILGKEYVSTKIDAAILTARVLNISLAYKLRVADNISDQRLDVEGLQRNVKLRFKRAVSRWVKDLLGDKEYSGETETYFIAEKTHFNECSWKSFPRNNFTVRNGSILLNNTKNVYTPETYRIMTDKIIVCVEDTADEKLEFRFTYALHAALIVGILIGLFCFGIQVLRTFKPHRQHKFTIG